jgi:hypothetical protein
MVMFLTGATGERDEQEARAIVVEGIRELGAVGRETGVRVGSGRSTARRTPSSR